MGLIKKIVVGSDSIETDVYFMYVEKIYYGEEDVTSNFTIIDYKPGVKMIVENRTNKHYAFILIKYSNGLYKPVEMSEKSRSFWGKVPLQYMNFDFLTTDTFTSSYNSDDNWVDFSGWYYWDATSGIFTEDRDPEVSSEIWCSQRRYAGLIS